MFDRIKLFMMIRFLGLPSKKIKNVNIKKAVLSFFNVSSRNLFLAFALIFVCVTLLIVGILMLPGIFILHVSLLVAIITLISSIVFLIGSVFSFIRSVKKNISKVDANLLRKIIDSEVIATAIVYLKQEKLFSHANARYLVYKANLAEAVNDLASRSQLNQHNLKLLLASKQDDSNSKELPDNLKYGIRKLQQKSLLNQKTRALLENSACPLSLADDLIYLNCHVKERFDELSSNSDLHCLVLIFTELKKSNLLNGANIDKVLKHDKLGIYNSCEVLSKAGVLHQENFDKIIKLNMPMLHLALKFLKGKNLLSDFDISQIKNPIGLNLAFRNLDEKGIVESDVFKFVAKNYDPFDIADFHLVLLNDNVKVTPTKLEQLRGVTATTKSCYKRVRKKKSPGSAFQITLGQATPLEK